MTTLVLVTIRSLNMAFKFPYRIPNCTDSSFRQLEQLTHKWFPIAHMCGPFHTQACPISPDVWRCQRRDSGKSSLLFSLWMLIQVLHSGCMNTVWRSRGVNRGHVVFRICFIVQCVHENIFHYMKKHTQCVLYILRKNV